MARLILVTFAFLAFVFYEMSGGNEFDPEATRLARIDAPSEVTQQPIDQPVVAETRAPVPENVTRVALSLTSVNDVLRPTNLRTTPAKVTPDVQAPEAVSEEEPVIILPSLIVDRAVITPVEFGRDADDQPTAVTLSSGNFDVRAVSGNRVNVRGGPGTDYSVVSSLVRGDKVEIMQDPGNGWVQMRPVGGGTIGWMADFLLNDG